jgi:cation:H+ antiporter
MTGHIAILLVGLVVTLGGAELLVRGAVFLARRLNVSEMIVGLTVVAYGTTAPEAVVSINATLEGVPAIAVGNVVGSNIANILLILGLAATISPIHLSGRTPTRGALQTTAAAILFVILAFSGTLTWVSGVVLLVLAVSTTVYGYLADRKDQAALAMYAEEVSEFSGSLHSLPVALLFVVAGAAGVIVGAHYLLEGAVAIARVLGVPEVVIGLTLVAVGTSLPELATAVVAALRGHPQVAAGNVLGANVFNVLVILGIASILRPLSIDPKIASFDMWAMLAATIVLLYCVVWRHGVSRALGVLFLICYGLYIAAQFFGMSGVA